MEHLDISRALLLTNLRYEGKKKNEYFECEEYITLGDVRWDIWWYPAGVEDRNSEEGYCCFKLIRAPEDQYEETEIHCSFVFMRNGEIIHEGKRFIWESYGIFDLVKSDLLHGGNFSLKVTISVAKYSFRETTFLWLKKKVGSLKKDVVLRSGKKSIEANATVLSVISPIFKAKLGSDSQWLESQEKSLDLGKDFEKYLKYFANFFDGDEIDLDITNKNHFHKFRALATFGDIYKIDNLLQYVLHKLTAARSKSVILNQLLLLQRSKHIKMFNDKAKSLTLWAYKNMTQEEYMELTSKVFWSDSEL